MKGNYPYRFKTESEFIEKFGDNWDKIIRYQWDLGGMKYLLGQVYPYYDKELINGPKMVDYWSISWDMLTENKPNYKPKKFNREL